MLKKLLACSLFAALAVPAASATVLNVGSGPDTFEFDGVGAPAQGNPFTFSGPAVVTIVDAYSVGDQFALYDGTVFLGDTSAPVLNGDVCITYASCVADPSFSNGVFTLGLGDHNLNIYAIASPYGGGAAFINAEAISTGVTPEPGSFALLGTGLLGVAGMLRRRVQV